VRHQVIERRGRVAAPRGEQLLPTPVLALSAGVGAEGRIRTSVGDLSPAATLAIAVRGHDTSISDIWTRSAVLV